MILLFSKCSKIVKIFDFKWHYKAFTSSYGAVTKFIRNTGLYNYGTPDVDLS